MFTNYIYGRGDFQTRDTIQQVLYIMHGYSFYDIKYGCVHCTRDHVKILMVGPQRLMVGPVPQWAPV